MIVRFFANPSPTPPLRWSRWWERALRTTNVEAKKSLAQLRAGESLVSDSETLTGLFRAFKEYPGWEGADGFGPPVRMERITDPAKQRAYVRALYPSDRERAVMGCDADPDLPRSARRRLAREQQRNWDKKLRARGK